MHIKYIDKNKWEVKEHNGKNYFHFSKPDSTIDEVEASILEGKEITKAQYDAKAAQWLIDNPPEPRQKTIKVMKTFERIEIIDGVPVLKTGKQEVDELVFEEKPVVDESGKPVMVKGNEKLMHKIPVMEDA
jgi:hypothetical protein